MYKHCFPAGPSERVERNKLKKSSFRCRRKTDRSTRGKPCGSKFGLETKWTYSAGTGNRSRAQWSTARRKYRYATCFNTISLWSGVVDRHQLYYYVAINKRMIPPKDYQLSLLWPADKDNSRFIVWLVVTQEDDTQNMSTFWDNLLILLMFVSLSGLFDKCRRLCCRSDLVLYNTPRDWAETKCRPTIELFLIDHFQWILTGGKQ